MTVPESLALPAALTDDRLRSVLAERRAEWGTVDPLLGEVLDHLERLVLAGGKRVRPAMAYWGHVGAGGDPNDPSLADLCAGLELLQAFALLHDDVMDDSPTRRGQPTAHVVESMRHEASGWSGEPRRYGEAMAILAGDVALVLSDVLLSAVNPEVRSYWNLLRVEVNLGQFLDVAGTARGSVGVSTAERIVEYKTARYTIVRPLQMGAALAGGAEIAERLEAVGTPLGIAFQLRDDLLGAFGDPERTGKPVGDDLSEGKPTPLLARAREAASDAELEILDRIGSALSTDEIREIQEALATTGAVAQVEAQIDQLTDEALAALASIELHGDAGRHLEALARYLAARSS